MSEIREGHQFSGFRIVTVLDIVSFWWAIMMVQGSCAIAQPIPDTTLGTESTTLNSLDPLIDVIEGGTTHDNFLFHSFSEFNVGEGRTVNFANPTGITDIFSRVTGNHPSQILGQLGVMGDANLFLLNPNGIFFGPNARLDVQGSFFATTAENIVFQDGFTFGVNPASTSLLTINVPIGLQYGSNPGPIVNRSQVMDDHGNSVGLQVPLGRTLALLGGMVTFDGGFLTAPQGQIYVSGVGAGHTVGLAANDNDRIPRYAGVDEFQDIQLIQGSMNTSGAGGGRIEIWGDHITLAKGSAVLADTVGNQNGQGILINASQFRILDGSQVSSSSIEESTGSNGAITVNVTDLVELMGSETRNLETNPGQGNNSGGGSGNNNDLQPSKLASDSRGLSQASENLVIDSPRLILQDGAKISASTIDSPGGDIIIHASDWVELVGVRSDGKRATGISIQTRGTGNSGNLAIQTGRLTVREGAEVIASTFGKGNGGNVEISATESVEILGTSPNGQFTSRLVAGTGETRTVDVGTFEGRGSAGNVMVNAPLLRLQEGQISADNPSPNAPEGGGNIDLVANILTLRDNASIFTNTASQNGGNIRITAARLEGLGNSEITANAAQKNGGNVVINTQDILNPNLIMITATGENSELNGTVIVNTAERDLTAGLVELPSGLVDITHLIAQTCSVTDEERESQFTITGRGGLPPNSRELIRSQQSGLADLGTSILPTETSEYSTPVSPNLGSSRVLVEANRWEIRSDGTIVLVATDPTRLSHPFTPRSCRL